MGNTLLIWEAPMNRFDAMTLFVRVVERGSFAATADQMGIGRSAVARQIAALEDHLGTKLFVRSTRRLSLTTAGIAYLERCQTILQLVEEAEETVAEDRQTPSGHLRISLPLSFGLRRLVQLLLEFSESYPDIRLSLNFSDRQLHLIEENIDLSVRITHQLQPNEIVRKLGECRLLTVAAPAYLKQHGRPQHPSQLTEHQCLGYSPAVNNQPWTYQVDGQTQTFYFPYRIQANNGDALARAAMLGFGVTMQPDFIVADDLVAGKLETILDSYEPPALGIYAVLSSNRYMPYRVRVLIDFLSDRLSDNSNTGFVKK